MTPNASPLFDSPVLLLAHSSTRSVSKARSAPFVSLALAFPTSACAAVGLHLRHTGRTNLRLAGARLAGLPPFIPPYNTTSKLAPLLPLRTPKNCAPCQPVSAQVYMVEISLLVDGFLPPSKTISAPLVLFLAFTRHLYVRLDPFYHIRNPGGCPSIPRSPRDTPS